MATSFHDIPIDLTPLLDPHEKAKSLEIVFYCLRESNKKFHLRISFFAPSDFGIDMATRIGANPKNLHGHEGVLTPYDIRSNRYNFHAKRSSLATFMLDNNYDYLPQIGLAVSS
ncbi:MAG: hypothetical protein V3V20_07680 [Algisphaera sp.]